MTFDRLIARVSLDSPSPLIKLVPTIFAFAIAIILLLLPSPVAEITIFADFVVAIVLVALASVLAAVIPWSRFPAETVIVIPVISLVAVGFFRLGTGGVLSPFGSVLLLPFVWIATEEGRINALIAAVGTFLVLFAPILADGQVSTGTDLVRAFYAPVIYLIVAFVINEIAHRVRQQLAAAEAASEQRKELLERAVRTSDELALNEARLKTANRLILSIWNAVTEQSVIGTDLDGLIDVWNPGAEKMLGLTVEQVRSGGRHVVDFHLQSELEDRLGEMDARNVTVSSPEDFSALVDAVRAGYADARDWTYVRADGKHVPVQVTATPRLDENGHRIGFIFVATDMTKSREFARLKDEFVGLISHELRTPLSSILGYLELMRDDEESPLSAEQLQFLGVAERNAHRLLRLVGDLLFTAQVESGQFPLDLRDLDLAEVVGASIESARPAASAAAIQLVARIGDGPVTVRGDAQRVGQAVDNLISNAIKFTPAAGTITVALEVDGPDACITVSDTGIGIPAVELGQLSTRFFRASTATRNAVPGVGLGLTITKAIVTAHGGRMSIASEEGVGTSFTVRIPLEGRNDDES
ncbi:sensor histidine kinase [Diaminobutyricibacter sp. McL0608]|uniref:sensor histidine kinase n=1 Tax=Leifsonia sp. McL0608 TaxID=3143537 RepID=UPI0031F2F87D